MMLVSTEELPMLVKKEIHVPLFDLISCLSDVIDLVNPELVNHHKKVAYIAYCLARQLGLPNKEKNDLLLAGMLHDIGALSGRERIRSMQFEVHNPHRHAEMGGRLLQSFTPLARTAELIRFHHVRWDGGDGKVHRGEAVPIGGHVLHLADRVSVLVRKSGNPLEQAGRICREVQEQSGGMFNDEVVKTFLQIARKDYFWLDVTTPSLGSLLRRRVSLETVELDLRELRSLASVFAMVIDFRSRFTATHSSGVAASAAVLAELAGCSERECGMMEVAGFFHDLGKLAIPADILEKPTPLTSRERALVRCHPYHTYRTLENIGDMGVINSWGAFHHECLNGNGYPFRLQHRDLSLGSRIMAVADVFTAITEDRPYRAGMSHEQALAVLDGMAGDTALDRNVVKLLQKNFDRAIQARESAQRASIQTYNLLQDHLEGFA